MLRPNIHGSHESWVKSLLVNLLGVVCLQCWITIIGWSRHVGGKAHRAASYIPYRGLGGSRLEAQILGRRWKMPPRTLMFVGSCSTSLQNVELDIEVWSHLDIFKMLIRPLLFMINSLELRASSPTMTRCPFTLKIIYMQSSCYIWGYITPTSDLSFMDLTWDVPMIVMRLIGVVGMYHHLWDCFHFRLGVWYCRQS